MADATQSFATAAERMQEAHAYTVSVETTLREAQAACIQDCAISVAECDRCLMDALNRKQTRTGKQLQDVQRDLVVSVVNSLAATNELLGAIPTTPEEQQAGLKPSSSPSVTLNVPSIAPPSMVGSDIRPVPPITTAQTYTAICIFQQLGLPVIGGVCVGKFPGGKCYDANALRQGRNVLLTPMQLSWPSGIVGTYTSIKDALAALDADIDCGTGSGGITGQPPPPPAPPPPPPPPPLPTPPPPCVDACHMNRPCEPYSLDVPSWMLWLAGVESDDFGTRARKYLGHGFAAVAQFATVDDMYAHHIQSLADICPEYEPPYVPDDCKAVPAKS